MIITGHLQRQPLMIRGRRDGRDVPFNRQDIYIGMRYLVPALGELLRQGEEKWICPEVVEENFQATKFIIYEIDPIPTLNNKITLQVIGLSRGKYSPVISPFDILIFSLIAP